MARGRALSQVRPGRFIKEYLSANSEASVAELHRAYIQALPKPPNRKRPRFYAHYSSFSRFFHWFLALGLVERTGGARPALYAVMTDQVLFRLTVAGVADIVSWDDPLRAAHPEWTTAKGHISVQMP